MAAHPPLGLQSEWGQITVGKQSLTESQQIRQLFVSKCVEIDRPIRGYTLIRYGESHDDLSNQI